MISDAACQCVWLQAKSKEAKNGWSMFVYRCLKSWPLVKELLWLSSIKLHVVFEKREFDRGNNRI